MDCILHCLVSVHIGYHDRSTGGSWAMSPQSCPNGGTWDLESWVLGGELRIVVNCTLGLVLLYIQEGNLLLHR